MSLDSSYAGERLILFVIFRSTMILTIWTPVMMFTRFVVILYFAMAALPVFAAEPGRWNCGARFGLCRYIDAQTGAEIIPPRYDHALPFSEGVAAVSIGGKFGYIDVHGETIIEPRFEVAGSFAHGLAEIVIGGKAGIVNRKGEIVVPPMFQRAVPQSSEVIVAVEGRWRGGLPYEFFDRVSELDNAGLYHIDGHWIQKPDPNLGKVLIDPAGTSLSWVLERGARQDLYGLMGSDGQWIVKPEYIYVSMLNDERRIVRKQVDDVQYAGAVDPRGRPVVPLRRWSLFYWLNGWGMAQQDGKRALVDKEGNIVGGRWFDAVERGETGDIARVLLDGRWQGMDRAGNIVADPYRDRAVASAGERPKPTPEIQDSQSEHILSCGGGLHIAGQDGLWGISDADGTPVIAPRYRAIDCFKNGVAWAAIDERRQWCPLGPDGTLRDNPQCRTTHYAMILSHSFPEKFADDPYESSVLWGRARLECGAGKRDQHPGWVGDGVRGGHGVQNGWPC